MEKRGPLTALVSGAVRASGSGLSPPMRTGVPRSSGRVCNLHAFRAALVGVQALSHLHPHPNLTLDGAFVHSV